MNGSGERGNRAPLTPKTALCVAYHFPPIRVSSGIQRTLKFVTYLRDHGWESVVLTTHPRAYEQTSSDQISEIPEGMIVRRAFALDTARHLSLMGRYPNWLAIPDRYWTWTIGGYISGLRLIRRYQPNVIWSTYPIATAHLIGALLHRTTGLPWVADFRDSMTEDNYPPDGRQWRAYRAIERYAVRHAKHCVFTTQGTRSLYASRYPDVPAERWHVVPNGYDEENFAAAEASLCAPPVHSNQLKLVHSGTLYPSERDPSKFFEAVAELKRQGRINARDLRVVLRATGHDSTYQPLLKDFGIDDIVKLQPGVSYQEALAEMLSSDGLLLFQAANSNHQIPAKLYEYVRTGKPILALTDPLGDTAKELKIMGLEGVTIAPLDNSAEIEAAMAQFVSDILGAGGSRFVRSNVRAYSRAASAEQFASVLDAATAAGPAPRTSA